MTPMRPHDDPRTETAKTALALAERYAALRTDIDAPPRPGDVFFLREADVAGVEWVMIEHRSSDRRLLVVPVDDHPFVGSRDVALSPEALGSAAHVRCDLGVWLDASSFEPELRTGRVSEHDLGRVRRKHRDISQGRTTDSLLEEEIDGDPEYRRWRDALRVAPATLSNEVDKIDAGSPQPTELGTSGRRPWIRLQTSAFAATIVLTLGLGSQTWQLQGRLDAERHRIIELEERDTARLQELEAQRREITIQGERFAISSKEARRYKKVLENTNAEVTRKRERIAELERVLKDVVDNATQVNVPWISFTHRNRTSRSGGALTYALPAEAGRVILALEIVNPEPYDRYRLRIVSKDGEEIFKSEQLVKLDGRWLRIDLPAVRLSEGKYELLVAGLSAKGFHPLEESDQLRIVRRFAD